MESAAKENAVKCVLVSMCGRAHWLAYHLKKLGWNVHVVDVTKLMIGEREWQSGVDGPFGLFENSSLSVEQKNFWSHLHSGAEQPQGFAILTREGPLEGQGPLTDFLLNARGLETSVVRYLREQLDGSEDKFVFEKRLLARKPFAVSWLAHFAHSFAANQMHDHFDACEQGQAMPVLAPFELREMTALSWQNEIKALQQMGVEWSQASAIEDLQILGFEAESLKFSDRGSSCVANGTHFVWSLTGRETEKLNLEVARRLFPEGTLEPEWNWVRFLADGNLEARRSALPEKFVVIDDLHLPWTHQNCAVLKIKDQRRMDVWLRVPVGYLRPDGQSLLAHAVDQTLEVLNQRLPQMQLQISDRDAQIASQTNACHLFPIFAEESLQGLKVIKTANVFFDGPEVWLGLDPLSQFQFQSLVAQKLESLRRVYETMVSKSMQKANEEEARQTARAVKKANSKRPGAAP